MTKWISNVNRALLGFCLVWTLALPAAAQETTGTITGVVVDQTGAVLPGVTVVVRNTQTGVSQEFITGDTGRYTAASLRPGTYEVTFNLSGFNPQTVRNIELHVNDRLEINGKLGVGVTETVEVSAASQFVQPSPAVQSLMGPTQVQELPLNNRNFVQLATLVPGVSSDLGDEVGIGLTNIVSVSINGSRRNAVNWLVDGVSNVDVGSNVTLLATPTLESIQEFKIITSNYAAEWPRSGGGVVNVVTRGGTQEFSGSVYEFFRSDALNANSWSRNRTGREDLRDPPELDYHNFGYTVGGPVLPSREKLFFFWSQEWRDITRAPASSTATVIDPAWLNDPSNPNFVPPDQRDANAVRLLTLWPPANQGTNQFVNINPNVNDTRQEVLRIDYDFLPNWKLMGRYTHDLSETVEPGGLFFNIDVPDVAATRTRVPGNVLSTELRTTLGRGLNEFRYQLSGNRITTEDLEANVNTRDALGLQIPELFPQNNANRIPTVSLSGAISQIGAIQGFNIEYWNHTFADNYTHQMGDHTIKGGFLFAFEQKNENANNTTQGSFTFGEGGGRTAFQNFLTGNRDGLCGNACSYTEAEIDITNNLRFNRYEMFVQDTWRIRPNVTLDYGVRYALYPRIVDKNDVLTNFVPSLYDPARRPEFADAAGTLLVPGTGDPLNGIIVAGRNSPFGRGIYETDTNNIQPRVGFSWDPYGEGTTIVRGGYGLYFDQPLVGIFEQNAFVNPPFVNNITLFNPALSNPGAGVAPGTTGLPSLIASSVPFETPRTQQWNIGVQRQLYDRGFIDVSYVGSRGDNLIQPVNINQPQPADVVAADGNLNLVRPFLGYGNITMRQTTAHSNYWGFLTQFRHDAGRNGTLTLNYTLSRNRTTSTNDRDAVDLPQNPLDLEAEYADARTDRRHIFTATYIYELPFFREAPNPWTRAFLGGWQISGLTQISSGPPVSFISTSTDGSRRGNRANQVGDPGAGDQSGDFWFDPTAFVPPALGAYGDSPRAPFRMPGRNQTDLALSKNFYPFRDLRLQFRADFINAFNQTQFSGIDTSCTGATALAEGRCDVAGDTFGQFTAARAPREIQLSLKLYW